MKCSDIEIHNKNSQIIQAYFSMIFITILLICCKQCIMKEQLLNSYGDVS